MLCFFQPVFFKTKNNTGITNYQENNYNVKNTADQSNGDPTLY